eukprot:3869106-Prymnesium_polylepis.1
MKAAEAGSTTCEHVTQVGMPSALPSTVPTRETSNEVEGPGTSSSRNDVLPTKLSSATEVWADAVTDAKRVRAARRAGLPKNMDTRARGSHSSSTTLASKPLAVFSTCTTPISHGSHLLDVTSAAPGCERDDSRTSAGGAAAGDQSGGGEGAIPLRSGAAAAVGLVEQKGHGVGERAYNAAQRVCGRSGARSAVACKHLVRPEAAPLDLWSKGTTVNRTERLRSAPLIGTRRRECPWRAILQRRASP